MSLADRTRYVSPADARLAAETLAGEGWRVISLPDGIVDRGTLVTAVSGLIPLDPPMTAIRSWDAFRDSLSSGVYDLGPRPVAIVWADPEPLRASAPDDFSQAAQAFADSTYIDETQPNRPPEVRFIMGVKDWLGPTRTAW